MDKQTGRQEGRNAADPGSKREQPRLLTQLVGVNPEERITSPHLIEFVTGDDCAKTSLNHQQSCRLTGRTRVCIYVWAHACVCVCVCT